MQGFNHSRVIKSSGSSLGLVAQGSGAGMPQAGCAGKVRASGCCTRFPGGPKGRDPPAATGMSGPTPCLHRSRRGCATPVGVLGLQTRGCFQGKGAQRRVLHHLLLCIEMLGYATREDGPWSSSSSRYEEKRQRFGGHPLGHCRAVCYKPALVLLSRQGLSL